VITASARVSLSASSPFRTASSNVLPSYTEPAIGLPLTDARASRTDLPLASGESARRIAASRNVWE
jgi:hypothetical protein